MPGKMTTLADLKKSIPPGGLLNPGLRKGVGAINLPNLKASLFPKNKLSGLRK
jgi:hypothetical protein